MLFEDRTEYDNWIKSGMPEQWGKNNKYSYIPDCDNCDFGKIMVDYENLGYANIPKTCSICLGLKKNKSYSKRSNKPKDTYKNKNFYIGAEFDTKYENVTLKIIKEGKDREHYWVEFQDEYRHKLETSIYTIEKGLIKNPYHRSVYSVGYPGFGDYSPTINGKTTEAYKDWVEMMRRCYSKNLHIRRPTYKDCEVCEEWHNFQVFAEWAENTGYLYKRWHLDKDLLSKDSKTYSPETCVYLPLSVNLLIKSDKEIKDIKKIKTRQLKISEIMEKYKEELDKDIYNIIMEKLDPVINYKLD